MKLNSIADCTKPMDLALVVDASGSIGNKSFQTVKEFLSNLTRQFNVSVTGTHVACLHYDHRVFPDFSFNDTQYYNQTNLDVKLRAMNYTSGSTVTQFALKAAITFFKVGNGARLNSDDNPRILVVFTDGKTHGGRTKLVGPVTELRVRTRVKIESSLNDQYL